MDLYKSHTEKTFLVVTTFLELIYFYFCIVCTSPVQGKVARQVRCHLVISTCIIFLQSMLGILAIKNHFLQTKPSHVSKVTKQFVLMLFANEKRVAIRSNPKRDVSKKRRVFI